MLENRKMAPSRILPANPAGQPGIRVQPAADAGAGNAPQTQRGLGELLAGSRDSTNVSNIAADFASQDNALMQRARTEGRQFANRRGLLNSSIAAQASQGAVLDRVIPMAQQESQQRFQGELSDQEFGQAQRLSDQEYLQNYSIQDARLATERDLAQLDVDTRVQLMDMESQLRERLARMELDQDDRNSMMSMITNFNQQYQEAYRSILSNPDLGAEDRKALMRSSGELLMRQTGMLEGLFDYDINWGQGSISSSRSGSARTGLGGTREIVDPFTGEVTLVDEDGNPVRSEGATFERRKRPPFNVLSDAGAEAAANWEAQERRRFQDWQYDQTDPRNR